MRLVLDWSLKCFLRRYDLVDVTKEVLRVRFISKYLELVKVWKSQDLYRFR